MFDKIECVSTGANNWHYRVRQEPGPRWRPQSDQIRQARRRVQAVQFAVFARRANSF